MSSLSRRLAGPFIKASRRLYYRHLYGAGSSLERRLAPVVEGWEDTSGRGDVPLSQEHWDQQYQRGDWDFLHGSDELARYGVIATYLRHRGHADSVLDIGCGEGILTSVMTPAQGGDFVGVDVSASAIERARARFAEPAEQSSGFESLRFEVADAEHWTPDDPAERFAAIVFNESVYYFRQPLESVQRFGQWLRPNGVFVVSMFETLRSEAIARRLEQHMTTLDRLWIEGPKGRWSLQVLRPGGA